MVRTGGPGLTRGIADEYRGVRDAPRCQRSHGVQVGSTQGHDPAQAGEPSGSGHTPRQLRARCPRAVREPRPLAGHGASHPGDLKPRSPAAAAPGPPPARRQDGPGRGRYLPVRREERAGLAPVLLHRRLPGHQQRLRALRGRHRPRAAPALAPWHMPRGHPRSGLSRHSPARRARGAGTAGARPARRRVWPGPAGARGRRSAARAGHAGFSPPPPATRRPLRTRCPCGRSRGTPGRTAPPRRSPKPPRP